VVQCGHREAGVITRLDDPPDVGFSLSQHRGDRPGISEYKAMAINPKFLEAAQSPVSWRFSAECLKQSSDLLTRPTENDLQFFIEFAASGFSKEAGEIYKAKVGPDLLKYGFQEQVAYMLLGMSFENLMKGLVVAYDKTIVGPEKLGSLLKTHNFEELAKNLEATTGIALSVSEIGLLHPAISDLVIWAGRYPTPTTQDRMKNEFTYPCREQLLVLWQKLYAALHAKIR
jgi:hypothetical protein